MQRNTYNNNNQEENGGDLVFVIETCQNCKSHTWNTRHDEAKYLEYFNRVSQAVVERIPNAVTMRNQIPKAYLPFDLYCNLIPNNDPNNATFMQVPRTGSFEVSYKGLLIFSKLQGGYWPNVELVASKCASIIDADRNGEDVSPYLASGSSGKRGSSPSKRSTMKKSPMKNETPSKAQAPAQDEQPVKPFKMDESQKFLEPVNEPETAQPVQQEEKPEPVVEQPVETICGRHLKHIDDLKSYPKFLEGERGSMLCKFLTEDVWNQLHDKTDSLGVTFKQCILSGC